MFASGDSYNEDHQDNEIDDLFSLIYIMCYFNDDMTLPWASEYYAYDSLDNKQRKMFFRDLLIEKKYDKSLFHVINIFG